MCVCVLGGGGGGGGGGTHVRLVWCHLQSTYSALDTNRGQDWGPDSTYAVANHGGGGGRNEPQETYAVANHSASAKGRAGGNHTL